MQHQERQRRLDAFKDTLVATATKTLFQVTACGAVHKDWPERAASWGAADEDRRAARELGLRMEEAMFELCRTIDRHRKCSKIFEVTPDMRDPVFDAKEAEFERFSKDFPQKLFNADADHHAAPRRMGYEDAERRRLATRFSDELERTTAALVKALRDHVRTLAAHIAKKNTEIELIHTSIDAFVHFAWLRHATTATFAPERLSEYLPQPATVRPALGRPAEDLGPAWVALSAAWAVGPGVHAAPDAFLVDHKTHALLLTAARVVGLKQAAARVFRAWIAAAEALAVRVDEFKAATKGKVAVCAGTDGRGFHQSVRLGAAYAPGTHPFA